MPPIGVARNFTKLTVEVDVNFIELTGRSSHELIQYTKEVFPQNSPNIEDFPQTSLKHKGGVPMNFPETNRRISC
jgi:hypothetical protein